MIFGKSPPQIDELLARGRLGGPRYDAILQRVLAETAPRTTRARRALVPGLAIAVAGLGAWLVLAPRTPEPFTAKGGAGTGAVAAALHVGCASSKGLVCRQGETLMFEVNAAIVSGYLGAYAERADGPAEERIWYFPSAGGESPRIEPAERTVVVPDGILLGDEHRPGVYRVTVWIAPDPLPRPAIDRADERAFGARASFEVRVLPATE